MNSNLQKRFNKTILEFKNFSDLEEEKSNKTIVFSFGRFQPPTIGHKLLVDKVVSLAKQHKADHVIYASRTQDKKSNPLDVNTKVKYLKKMFPKVNFEAANDNVRTFIEALKSLHKNGYKHVYMIAGSDRLADYQRLFDKYNGGDDFNFQTLKAVSAGERDPDAEGASGMSGTKMRQAALDNDFASFRRGIPSTLSDADAKKLMREIKRVRTIKEFFEYTSEELLSEGVNDKSIFKAVFLAGGPGSGKDYVLRKTLEGHGLVEINSDNAFEYLLDKYNLDKKMPDAEEEQRNAIRVRAKSIKELKERLAIQGRNGLIINGTGEDAEKIASLKLKLEGLGYDTQMLFVHTKNEVSQQRNVERGEAGGRTVPEDIRQEKWDNAQKNRKNFKDMFEGGYVEFDNSEDLRNADSEVIQAKEAQLLDLFKRFRKFTETAPSSDEASLWIKDQKLIDKSLANNPPPQSEPEQPNQDVQPQMPQAQQPQAQVAPTSQQDVAAAGQTLMQQAAKMGLTYYGFGRFGKNGQTTHIEQNGKLIPFKSVNEEFKPFKTPKEIAKKHDKPIAFIMAQLKMGIKVEKEHTKEPEMARKIALQHLDELPDYYSRLKKIEKPLKENYEFSGNDARTLLTLGRKQVESYDSPSIEAPSVFGHSKDDWKKGKTSVTELSGDTELATITFQKDDETKKRGFEPFSTFKSKNPVG